MTEKKGITRKTLDVGCAAVTAGAIVAASTFASCAKQTHDTPEEQNSPTKQQGYEHQNKDADKPRKREEWHLLPRGIFPDGGFLMNEPAKQSSFAERAVASLSSDRSVRRAI